MLLLYTEIINSKRNEVLNIGLLFKGMYKEVLNHLSQFRVCTQVLLIG